MNVIRLCYQRLDCGLVHCGELLHPLKVLATEADTAAMICLPVATFPWLES